MFKGRPTVKVPLPVPDQAWVVPGPPDPTWTRTVIEVRAGDGAEPRVTYQRPGYAGSCSLAAWKKWVRSSRAACPVPPVQASRG